MVFGNVDEVSAVDARIIIAGNAQKVFGDTEIPADLPVKVCESVLDAVEMAGRGNFSAAGLVLEGSAGRMASVVEAFRRADSTCRVFLLARMWQEPEAAELVADGGAKDYLICPVTVSSFCEFITGLHKQRADSSAPTAPSVEKIREMERLATTDELTSLKNRRYTWEFTRQIIKQARRDKAQVTLLIFDIDNFKHYNDVYGHFAGDEILRQAAVLMKRSCRRHDIVGRIGGDEFAVIFWDASRDGRKNSRQERRSVAAEHPREAVFIASRFRNELKKTYLPSLGPEGKGVLTISGGLTSFPREADTAEGLFEMADQALLTAKRAGKNRIHLVGSSEQDIK